MREAASCGFWVASRAPHSYKKRSTLEEVTSIGV